MSDLRALVEQMRALCEKATPGPWTVYGDWDTLAHPPLVCPISSDRAVAECSSKHVTAHIHAPPGVIADRRETNEYHNSQFIAACREAVPQLLDALAGAEKELGERNGDLVWWKDHARKLSKMCESAEARLSRLRELGRQVVEWGERCHPGHRGGGVSELKPCPFCGGEATAELTMQDTKVGCPNKECGVYLFRRNDKRGRRNETAIAAWNRRPS